MRHISVLLDYQIRYIYKDVSDYGRSQSKTFT